MSRNASRNRAFFRARTDPGLPSNLTEIKTRRPGRLASRSPDLRPSGLPSARTDRADARLPRLATDFRHTNYASSAWIPPFLARVHHLSSVEIGTYAGTFKGLCGMAGTLVGGLVVAQISRRDDRWKLWAPAITSDPPARSLRCAC